MTITCARMAEVCYLRLGTFLGRLALFRGRDALARMALSSFKHGQHRPMCSSSSRSTAEPLAGAPARAVNLERFGHPVRSGLGWSCSVTSSKASSRSRDCVRFGTKSFPIPYSRAAKMPHITGMQPSKSQLPKFTPIRNSNHPSSSRCRFRFRKTSVSPKDTLESLNMPNFQNGKTMPNLLSV